MPEEVLRERTTAPNSHAQADSDRAPARPSPAFKNVAQAQFDVRAAAHELAVQQAEGNEKAIHEVARHQAVLWEEFSVLREEFEAKAGSIERQYWAEYCAVAVVLTAKPRRWVLRTLGLSPRYALYRSTESAGLPYEFEAALADGDTLACKAGLVLSGGAAVTVLNRIFEAHKFLLSAVDAEASASPDWRERMRSASREEEEQGDGDRVSLAAEEPSTPSAS